MRLGTRAQRKHKVRLGAHKVRLGWAVKGVGRCGGICRESELLQTRVYDLLGSTQFALNLAAPVEGARASLHHNHLLRAIATPTAHQIAPVDAQRGVVALSPVGAEYALSQILLAEAGRGLQIDNVLGARRLVLGIVWIQLEVISGGERERGQESGSEELVKPLCWMRSFSSLTYCACVPAGVPDRGIGHPPRADCWAMACSDDAAYCCSPATARACDR